MRVKNKTLYHEIKHLDIIAKAFKVHQPCYQKFTFEHSTSTKSTNEESSNKMEQVYLKGNFQEVKEYIYNIVLSDMKAASMTTLDKIHNLNVGDTRYRAKLKQRIQKEFGEKIQCH